MNTTNRTKINNKRFSFSRLNHAIEVELRAIDAMWLLLFMPYVIYVLLVISTLNTHDSFIRFPEFILLEDRLILNYGYGYILIALGLLVLYLLQRNDLKLGKQLRDLSSPFSHLEKYLAKWIITCLFLIILHTFICYFTNLLLWFYFSFKGVYLDMPSFFNIYYLYVTFIYFCLNAVGLYFSLVSFRLFKMLLFIVGLPYFSYTLLNKIILFRLMTLDKEFKVLDTYHYYFMGALAVLSLILGYFAIKHKQLA